MVGIPQILGDIFMAKRWRQRPNYNRINEWPLQFLRTGYYRRSYGYLNARTANGIWWSDTAGSATVGRRLLTNAGGVLAQANYWRGGGFALRCVSAALKP